MVGNWKCREKRCRFSVDCGWGLKNLLAAQVKLCVFVRWSQPSFCFPKHHIWEVVRISAFFLNICFPFTQIAPQQFSYRKPSYIFKCLLEKLRLSHGLVVSRPVKHYLEVCKCMVSGRKVRVSHILRSCSLAIFPVPFVLIPLCFVLTTCSFSQEIVFWGVVYLI